MKTFLLPDLAEGLTEAEIHEWYIKEGDEVSADQPVVAMETAKAVVDVPAPRAGVISKFHGQVGDIIDTHAPLFEYADGEDKAKPSGDSGTVVGNMPQGEAIVLEESATGVGASQSGKKVKALPAVRALARKLNVDLNQLTGTGANGQITKEDVENAGQAGASIDGGEALRGVRRAMAQAMSASHAQVVPVTIVEDADIHDWPEKTDATIRVIQAIASACASEPALNVWFDGKSRQLHDQVHLGIAMDAGDGLFVPVIKDIAKQDAASLRASIDRFKTEVADRSIAQQALQGATIMLSNFGTFAGRYANPIIVPPCVAILGTGRMREQVVLVNDQAESHRIIPLSLTVDHRAVTGGEAARFLAAVISALQT